MDNETYFKNLFLSFDRAKFAREANNRRNFVNDFCEYFEKNHTTYIEQFDWNVENGPLDLASFMYFMEDIDPKILDKVFNKLLYTLDCKHDSFTVKKIEEKNISKELKIFSYKTLLSSLDKLNQLTNRRLEEIFYEKLFKKLEQYKRNGNEFEDILPPKFLNGFKISLMKKLLYSNDETPLLGKENEFEKLHSVMRIADTIDLSQRYDEIGNMNEEFKDFDKVCNILGKKILNYIDNKAAFLDLCVKEKGPECRWWYNFINNLPVYCGYSLLDIINKISTIDDRLTTYKSGRHIQGDYPYGEIFLKEFIKELFRVNTIPGDRLRQILLNNKTFFSDKREDEFILNTLKDYRIIASEFLLPNDPTSDYKSLKNHFTHNADLILTSCGVGKFKLDRDFVQSYFKKYRNNDYREQENIDAMDYLIANLPNQKFLLKNFHIIEKLNLLKKEENGENLTFDSHDAELIRNFTTVVQQIINNNGKGNLLKDSEIFTLRFCLPRDDDPGINTEFMEKIHQHHIDTQNQLNVEIIKDLIDVNFSSFNEEEKELALNWVFDPDLEISEGLNDLKNKLEKRKNDLELEENVSKITKNKIKIIESKIKEIDDFIKDKSRLIEAFNNLKNKRKSSHLGYVNHKEYMDEISSALNDEPKQDIASDDQHLSRRRSYNEDSEEEQINTDRRRPRAQENRVRSRSYDRSNRRRNNGQSDRGHDF